MGFEALELRAGAPAVVLAEAGAGRPGPPDGTANTSARARTAPAHEDGAEGARTRAAWAGAPVVVLAEGLADRAHQTGQQTRAHERATRAHASAHSRGGVRAPVVVLAEVLADGVDDALVAHDVEEAVRRHHQELVLPQRRQDII